jgi:hypothetical protein
MLVFTEPTRQKPLPSVLARRAWRQRGDLDRVADRRAGAVALDVVQRVGAHVCDRERFGDARGLAVDRRREVADLARAVVVDRRP